MSGFNRGLLEEKLRVLSSSQHSIQTLSLWMIHHRSHAGAAVEIWLRELLAASPPRKLSLVYLANDAVLQSRKSGTGALLHALSLFSLAVGGERGVPTLPALLATNRYRVPPPTPPPTNQNSCVPVPVSLCQGQTGIRSPPPARLVCAARARPRR